MLSELTDGDAVEDAVGAAPCRDLMCQTQCCWPCIISVARSGPCCAGAFKQSGAAVWDALQEEEAAALVEGLLDNDALSLLVHRLNAFNESVPEEAAAVYNVLTIFENIIEVKPDVAELVLEKTKVRCKLALS